MDLKERKKRIWEKKEWSHDALITSKMEKSKVPTQVLTKTSYLMINGKFKNLYSGYSALHMEGALKAQPGKVIKIHERNSGQSKNTVLL